MLIKKLGLLLLFLLGPQIWGTTKGSYHIYRKRPYDYFDQRYDQDIEKLNRIQEEKKKPDILSKGLRRYIEEEKAIKEYNEIKAERRAYTKSAEHYQTMMKIKRRQREELELMKEINKIKDFRMQRRWRHQRPLRPFKPENMQTLYDFDWGHRALRPYYIKMYDWENIKKYGLTLAEIDGLLIVISVIRFCFYTIKYNARAGLIISLTGFFCAFLYTSLLPKVLYSVEEALYLEPSIFRLGFEHVQYRIKMYQMLRTPPPGVGRRLTDDISLADYYPAWLWRFVTSNRILNEIQNYFDQYLLVPILKYLKRYWSGMWKLSVYIYITRYGRSFVPYPIRYHGTIYTMWNLIWTNTTTTLFFNSVDFLTKVLIPELRLEEIEMMEILHAAFAMALIYGILLAALHALFSQYFYIPFVSQAIEAQVGKREKDSILSGGYTSWQDQQELWKPSKADFKFWFGFLGKDKYDKKSKIRKQNEKKAKKVGLITNWIYIILAVLIFNFCWSQQPTRNYIGPYPKGFTPPNKIYPHSIDR